jgi:hypothetical protein
MNINVVGNTIRRGFIDPNKVPTLDEYPVIQRISQAMWLLKRKLDVSETTVSVRKATVRVYDSWAAFLKQLGINFSRAFS